MIGGALLLGGAAAPKQAAPQPAAQSDAFQDQAAKLGVKRCANLFSAFGQSAANGANYSVQVRANREAPDTHAVIGIAGLTYQGPQYSGSAAGIALAVPVGQGCEGLMVRVTPFQKSCQEVVALFPQGSTLAANLSGVPLYNLGQNQGQAMLVSSGATCVVTTVAPGGIAS